MGYRPNGRVMPGVSVFKRKGDKIMPGRGRIVLSVDAEKWPGATGQLLLRSWTGVHLRKRGRDIPPPAAPGGSAVTRSRSLQNTQGPERLTLIKEARPSPPKSVYLALRNIP